MTDGGSLAQLVGQARPLVLLLADPALAADVPIRQRHRLVVLAPPGQAGDVTVPPVDGQVVGARLRAAGLPVERADSLGVLARRSLLALRRSLAVNPAIWTPSWATGPDIVRRRLLLLGAWAGANADDRRVVEQCVGRPYSDVQEAALALAMTPETPFLGHVDEQWHLLSPQDAWTLLSGHLTRDDLEAFRITASEVLGEPDPLLGLDGADRWKAGLQGVRRRFSSGLRHAFAQTLALLGGGETPVRTAGGMTGARWARPLVRDLLARANADGTYALWTSLGDVLPLLAEAAPEEFLEAMADGLTERAPLHARMFTDAARDDFGLPAHSPHTAFLRSLEVLAWSADHFDDVIDVLGRLAALDPGGQWSNRPSRSLAEILSCWSPNTSAGVDQRIRALERLLRREPRVARRLLIALIPDAHGFQTVHPGPRFRDWRRESPLPRADLARAVNAVVEMLLDDLGTDGDRYLALLGKVAHLSPAHRNVFAERLARFGASLTDDALRGRLFDALRGEIARHREYADADWALPPGELESLQAAADAVKPQDLVRRTAWLFASGLPELGDLSRRDDHHAYRAAVDERRVEAIREILRTGGLPAVETLASSTDHPHLVGAALAQADAGLDADLLAWLREDGRGDVAFAYFGRRLGENGTPLRDRLLAQTDAPLSQARILRAASDPPSAWEQLPRLAESVSAHYWREFSYFGLGASFGHVLTAARALIDVGRHAAALDLVILYSEQNETAEAAEVIAEACEGLLAGVDADPEFPQLGRHAFERSFALLARYRDEVGRHRVVRIEWQLFPVLGFDADAPTLHAALAEDPAFFAELVGHAYRPDQSDAADPDDEHRRLLARRAYEVLHTWRRCPGVTAGRTVDRALLEGWVTAARDRLRDDDRVDSGDGQIGRILAYAPPDPDGMFPPKAVRVLLEDVRSGRLDTGLELGILNKRGVTSRGLLDGGAQEWELAKSHRRQAGAAAPWPRTKKILNRIADSYESDALREDEKAERRRRGIHD